MGRNLIVGDLHASYERLMEVLDKAAFSSDDKLFFTGDLVDRGEKPMQLLRFLRGLENFYPVLGNHDLWLQNYCFNESVDPLWLHNGGWSTLEAISEEGATREELQDLGQWLLSFPFVRFHEDYLIVHAGLDTKGKPLAYYKAMADIQRTLPELGVYHTDKEFFDIDAIIFDRDFLIGCMRGWKGPYSLIPEGKRVFVGHTPLQEPFISRNQNLVALDTGGFSKEHGHLTLLDMDTLE